MAISFSVTSLDTDPAKIESRRDEGDVERRHVDDIAGFVAPSVVSIRVVANNDVPTSVDVVATADDVTACVDALVDKDAWRHADVSDNVVSIFVISVWFSQPKRPKKRHRKRLWNVKQ